MRALPSSALSLLIATCSAGCTWAEQRLADVGDCFLYRWHHDAIACAVEAKVGPFELGVGGWYAEWGWGKDTFWQEPGFLLTSSGFGVPFSTLSPLAYGEPWWFLFATSVTGNHPGAPEGFTDVRSWLLLRDVFDFDDSSPFLMNAHRSISDQFGLADLLLGCCGLDIFGDDGRKRPPTLPFVPSR
jgi:hypothetical protein